jgi:hypothetical protein
MLVFTGKLQFQTLLAHLIRRQNSVLTERLFTVTGCMHVNFTLRRGGHVAWAPRCSRLVARAEVWVGRAGPLFRGQTEGGTKNSVTDGHVKTQRCSTVINLFANEKSRNGFF